MKTVDVGVIGTGTISQVHLDAYKNNPYCNLKAVCDVNEDRVNQVAEKYEVEQIFTDYKNLLESDLDGLSVCVPNDLHAPIAIDALNAGKHVLCEKPLAINSELAQKMVQASAGAGKTLMVGFNKRFKENTIVINDFIRAERFGRIYYAKAACVRRCGSPGGWFTDKKRSGGGPLIDLGVHSLDLMTYLMGKPKVKGVLGNTFSGLGARGNIKHFERYQSLDYSDFYDVEDFANALILFENGSSIYIEVSFSQNIKEDQSYIEIYGENGGARVEPKLELYTEENDYLVDLRPITKMSKSGYQMEIDHFVDCIANGTRCIAPGEDGMAVLKITEAIYRSAESGEMERAE